MSVPGTSSRLPAHPSIQPLSTYILAPPAQANKKSAPVFVRASDAVSKQRKMGRMPTVKAYPKFEAVTRYFANSLYPKRVPLGFFAFSASDEPVTLSPVTLALRHLSKNAIFDAKPPVSEAVTLSPPKLFFVNRPFVPPRSQILNVTASNIFLSVK